MLVTMLTRFGLDPAALEVTINSLGEPEEREATLEGLRSSHGVIQSRIAAETRMKRTPTLTFHYDDTIEQGVRISKLLDDEPPAEGAEPADAEESR